MATVARKARSRSAPDSDLARLSVLGVCGLEESTVASAPYSQGRFAPDVPFYQQAAFVKARKWTTPGPAGPPNSFIAGIIALRHAFYDFGFKLTGSGRRFEEWRRINHAAIESYRRDAWLEWLRVDNVVALWRAGGRPFRLKPESCTYTDTFAVETLEYTHGLSGEQIEALRLPPAQKKYLREHPTLHLTRTDDSLFGFEVIKRAAVGEGLAWPGLLSAFLAASAHESLEVSDAQLAAQMRTVFEQHLWGHETRYGVQAGGSQNFLKKPVKDAVERALKPVKGSTRIVTRHDYKIIQGAGLPDPKFFEPKRYQGMKDRLLDWSLPLGQMLVAKTLNPYLLQFLKILAQGERALLKGHLEAVLTRAFGAPGPVTVTWGNKCFNDSRLAFDMIKNSLAAGPLSQETYLEDTDQDPTTERERKQAEAALPDAATQPLVTPQGAAVTDRAGRKRGSNDRKDGA